MYQILISLSLVFHSIASDHTEFTPTNLKFQDKTSCENFLLDHKEDMLESLKVNVLEPRGFTDIVITDVTCILSGENA